jgi:hypothetical protein
VTRLGCLDRRWPAASARLGRRQPAALATGGPAVRPYARWPAVTGAAGIGRGRAGGELGLGLLAREAVGWRWLCPQWPWACGLAAAMLFPSAFSQTGRGRRASETKRLGLSTQHEEEAEHTAGGRHTRRSWWSELSHGCHALLLWGISPSM